MYKSNTLSDDANFFNKLNNILPFKYTNVSEYGTQSVFKYRHFKNSSNL